MVFTCHALTCFRFEKDIEDMIGHRPNWYLKIMWLVVSPVLLIVLFIYYIVNYILGGSPTYQAWNKEIVSQVWIFNFLKKRILSSGKCKSYRMIDRHIGRIIWICVSGHVLTLIVFSSGKIKSSGISPLWSTLHWAAFGIICQLCSPDSIICLLQEKETWKPTWEATYN